MSQHGKCSQISQAWWTYSWLFVYFGEIYPGYCTFSAVNVYYTALITGPKTSAC